VSMASGVALPHMQFLSFGCEFFDYDADGWRDLVVANGHVQTRVATSFDNVTYAERRQLFHNAGNGSFTEVIAGLGDLSRPMVSRGLAVGDVNNDGGLDILMNSQNGDAELFLNRAPRGHWVSFRTVGTKCNRDGRHARVAVTAGGRTQVSEVRSGSSYASHSDSRLYFGLGASTRVERVEARWPDGDRDTARDLPADAIYTLTEGRGAAPSAPR